MACFKCAIVLHNDAKFINIFIFNVLEICSCIKLQSCVSFSDSTNYTAFSIFKLQVFKINKWQLGHRHFNQGCLEF